MSSDKARAVLHSAYMQGYRDGRASMVIERREAPRKRVCALLMERLEDGPQPAVTMLKIAQDAGVHENTLRAAKVELGIESERKAEGWVWRLPVKATKATS